jgi:flavodoxin
MRRGISLLLAALVLCGLAACGFAEPAEEAGPPVPDSTAIAEPAETPAEPAGEPPEAAEPAPEEHSDVLVVVFSATGTTLGVAEKIAAITGADLYEIQPAIPYTEEDLNYSDSGTRATLEQNDPEVRPEIAGEPISPDGYTTVYLGSPIWWGQEPRIMDTFVESFDFDGLTVIPFCTSGSSGISRCEQDLQELSNGGTWLPGRRFDGGVTEEELAGWIDSLQP